MKKLTLIVGLVIGFVFGALFGGMAIKIATPNMLFKEIRSPYSVDETVKIIVDRINKLPGWHVVTVIDQREEILKYGGPDVGPVKIIKFCSGPLAGKMLSSDDRKFFAVKMPASIAVYQKSDGRTYINVMNSMLMARLFSGETGDIIEQVVRAGEQILGFVHFRYTLW